MRTRRHTSGGLGISFGWTKGSPWRRFARDLGLIALTALVGYVVSALWVAPDAVLASEHSVPRVLELPAEKAKAAAEAAAAPPPEEPAAEAEAPAAEAEQPTAE